MVCPGGRHGVVAGGAGVLRRRDRGVGRRGWRWTKLGARLRECGPWPAQARSHSWNCPTWPPRPPGIGALAWRTWWRAPGRVPSSGAGNCCGRSRRRLAVPLGPRSPSGLTAPPPLRRRRTGRPAPARPVLEQGRVIAGPAVGPWRAKGPGRLGIWRQRRHRPGCRPDRLWQPKWQPGQKRTPEALGFRQESRGFDCRGDWI